MLVGRQNYPNGLYNLMWFSYAQVYYGQNVTLITKTDKDKRNGQDSPTPPKKVKKDSTIKFYTDLHPKHRCRNSQ